MGLWGYLHGRELQLGKSDFILFGSKVFQHVIVHRPQLGNSTIYSSRVQYWVAEHLLNYIAWQAIRYIRVKLYYNYVMLLQKHNFEYGDVPCHAYSDQAT